MLVLMMLMMTFKCHCEATLDWPLMLLSVSPGRLVGVKGQPSTSLTIFSATTGTLQNSAFTISCSSLFVLHGIVMKPWRAHHPLTSTLELKYFEVLYSEM